jgi:hypothetical protein
MASNSIAIPILPRIRGASEFPKILEHALPKIDIRSKTQQIHLKTYHSGWLGCVFEGRKGEERARFPQPAP